LSIRLLLYPEFLTEEQFLERSAFSCIHSATPINKARRGASSTRVASRQPAQVA